MKKILFFALTICTLSIFSFTAKAEEKIQLYDVHIKVENDGSLDIFEDISLNVEHDKIKLGIYRDIPKSYNMNGKKVETPVEIISVNRNGNPENFWIEDHGYFIRLQIGPEKDTIDNRLPLGTNTYYTIHWKTKNHIRGFKNYDELYFNVTGNNWDFPINQAMAYVQLPLEASIIQYDGYIGKNKSTERALFDEGNNDQSKVFFTPRSLKPKEGLTLALGFSKGIVSTGADASAMDELLNRIMEFGNPLISPGASAVIFSLLVTLSFYIVMWFLYGKDDDIGVITPSFNPPANISIPEAASIYAGKRVNLEKSFCASIVNLAAQGFININDKSITKKESNKEPRFEDEKLILGELFKNKNNVNIGTYSSSISNILSKYKTILKNAVNKYIKTNNIVIIIALIMQALVLTSIPEGSRILGVVLIISIISLFYMPFYIAIFAIFRSKNYIIGTIMSLFIVPHSLVFLTAMPMSILYNGEFLVDAQYFILIGTIAISMVTHIIFYYLMDKPLPSTTKILNMLEGLRMFMETTDKDRYRLVTPPIFERNLPYAIIFGLEKKWIENFEALNPSYNPEWYKSKKGLLDYTSMSNFRNTLSKSSISPASSGGGSSFGSSSGSSGGGSSGGGSGGGGGGGR